MRLTKPIITLAVILSIAASMTACGRRGDPLPPGTPATTQ